MMMLLIFISSCVGGAAAEVEAEDGVDDQSVFLSVMQSCFLLNSTLQSTEGVLSSFRTTWQELVEDLGFCWSSPSSPWASSTTSAESCLSQGGEEAGK